LFLNKIPNLLCLNSFSCPYHAHGSALNELLALKTDLRLLLDYTLRVEHDEQLITDNDSDVPAIRRLPPAA
jgi:hypothetical protein